MRFIKSIINSGVTWRRRFKYRSSVFKVSIISLITLSIYFLFFVALPYTQVVWSDLGPRTPLGSGSRLKVSVQASHLSPKEHVILKDQTPGIAVHQTTPQLALVGVGEEVSGEGEDVRLDIGLFPQHTDLILREDTRFHLRFQAPSLELLTEDLLNSKRGEKLKRSFDDATGRISKSWGELFPDISKALKRHLDPALFTKITQDQYVIGVLKEAFYAEIGSQVDLKKLGGDAMDSRELERLTDLTFERVNPLKIVRQAVGGFSRSVKVEGRETFQDLKEAWSGDHFIADSVWCGAEAFLALKVTILSGGVGPCARKLLSRLGQSAKKVVISTAKDGAKEVGSQALENIERNQGEIIKETKKLAIKVKDQAQVEVRLKRFWSYLEGHEALKAHIIKQYGDEAWSKWMKAVGEIGQSDQVQKKMNTLIDEVKELGRESMSAVILDHQGKGPNPLLLSVIQEQLKGQQRPIVHVTPGTGTPVKSGYLFKGLSTLIGG